MVLNTLEMPTALTHGTIEKTKIVLRVLRVNVKLTRASPTICGRVFSMSKQGGGQIEEAEIFTSLYESVRYVNASAEIGACPKFAIAQGTATAAHD